MKKKFFRTITPALFLLTASLLAGNTTIYADTSKLTYEAAASTETIENNEKKEYEFTTPDKAVFTTIDVTNTSCKALTVSVFDKNEKELYKKSSNKEMERITISFDTEATETYRIVVQGNEGSFTLDVNYSEDLGGSDETTCSTIADGKEYNWRMDNKEDEDYAIFVPSQSVDTKVTLTNKDCDNKLEAKVIHAKSGEQIFSTSTTATNGNSASATHTLTAGDTYVIKIAGASKGNYSIKVEQQKITNITLPATLHVTVGTPYKLQPTVTQSGGTEPFVTYTTGSSTIATVNSEGTITPLQTGKVTITATATDGFGIKAKTVVYVTPSKMDAPIVKNKNYASTQLSLSWNKTPGSSGYYIYQYDTTTSTWKLVKTITSGRTLSCTISNLSPLTAYRFRITAYKKIGSIILESKQSSSAYWITAPAKTSISDITLSNGTVKVTPKKLSKASGYEIRYSNTKAFSSYYKYSFTKSSVSFKPHLSQGTWYMQIRAYKNYRGERVYGKWGGTKSFTIK